jgi:hypothetical protein
LVFDPEAFGGGIDVLVLDYLAVGNAAPQGQ